MNNTLHGARKIDNLSFLEKLVINQNHAIIDVRSPVDYRDGTLLDAPNAALRNFITVYSSKRKDTNKFILIGSKKDTVDLEACIRYANNFPQPDKKQLKISYVLYEDILERENDISRGKRKGA